ncbi:MAG: haloacid dehalogenase-like hydrolase, partial [Planctomycetota bacterium]
MFTVNRRKIIFILAAALFLLCWMAFAGARADDPLPSWNDTAPKKAILAFVEAVTKDGGPHFVPP